MMPDFFYGDFRESQSYRYGKKENQDFSDDRKIEETGHTSYEYVPFGNYSNSLCVSNIASIFFRV